MLLEVTVLSVCLYIINCRMLEHILIKSGMYMAPESISNASVCASHTVARTQLGKDITGELIHKRQ